MNLVMIGARILSGRNLRPAIHRLGPRISRTCETSDKSIRMPSTGVANTHSRISMPIEYSRISTTEEPSPKTRVLVEKSKVRVAVLAIFRVLLKSKRLLRHGLSTDIGLLRLTLS